MSSGVFVNLRQAFLNAPGFWESFLIQKPGNWCKWVEGIDKALTDGYSILGNFVNQIDQPSYQKPGLYLYCEKSKQKRGISQRLYTLFVLKPDGSVQVLDEFKSASKDWAVQLWPTIDAHFIQQSQPLEKRRKQLLEEIHRLEFELNQRRLELEALEP
ncbi:MAG: hypothetical protein HC825_11845 [Oscillatoriales cyanobacterium RM1_1_9]|nr:hypothetical protein [Oscillatoriales cyanobacterium SM2_3_0]NJO47879.1 hypothetical protein [Oscillatoriales cyanobacterium RM2_1_1]NJO72166.1 hypothetical protein [Oscillatoriales cyanobacterium RM1_1_9]